MKIYVKASSGPKMSYRKFQAEYSWALKKYPDTSRLWDCYYPFLFTMDEVEYTKERGRWIETSNTTEEISLEQYMNIIDSIPFFKNLGGSEKVKVTSVVGPGQIPTEIESISPDRNTKTIRKFTITKSKQKDPNGSKWLDYEEE